MGEEEENKKKGREQGKRMILRGDGLKLERTEGDYH